MTRTITDMNDLAISIDLLSQLTVMAFARAYKDSAVENEGEIVLNSIEKRLKEFYSEDDVHRVMAGYRESIEMFLNWKEE